MHPIINEIIQRIKDTFAVPAYPDFAEASKRKTDVNCVRHLLASKNSTIFVLQAATNGTILGVPFSPRKAAEIVYKNHMKEVTLKREGTAIPRISLLCNAAAKGYGK